MPANGLDRHTIREIRVTPVETYFGSPGNGRIVGRNSKSENYGINQREWLLQVTTDSGLTGLSNARPAMNRGPLSALHDVLKDLIGRELSDFFTVSGGRVTGVSPRWSDLIDRHGFIDVALFDLIGQALGQPSHTLLGDRVRDEIEGYDSTLYFQDLVNPTEGAGAVAREAAEAIEKGWRAVKLKLGRPGKWFEPSAGTRRDIEVVEAVRARVGDDIKILIDANNGYDDRLDLLEDFIRGIRDLDVYWMEEMITEEIAGYRKLREWRDRDTPQTMIVDGEGDRGRDTIYWQLMEERLLDAIQPDMLHMGFWPFHVLARDIEESGHPTLIAPHNYNAAYLGLRANIQFGAVTERFVIAEDSTLDFELYRSPEYVFKDGKYAVPTTPGLAVSIDQELYNRVYKQHETLVR
ncbi:MAG: enolase C-terminal domain-like protein [Dehalococcoidia bacterium]|jgi:L-alanine-DL-glutamate epimerase-like enolase superfamily enzyme|nr:enolase C-terminal domain-like protein [Dehalococcoidia bacterium]